MVEAASAPVAVFPEEVCTDLRCCVFGKLYMKKVRVPAAEFERTVASSFFRATLGGFSRGNACS